MAAAKGLSVQAGREPAGFCRTPSPSWPGFADFPSCACPVYNRPIQVDVASRWGSKAGKLLDIKV